ncbi:hypothetical protein SmJEL517_g01982 [Synchytrium microbalum]|uniref:Uncharacterized protein n=1 Tax=Synchytrium microbalum TaxID=1806994 RepID=A0A507CDK6_9FUNG|nr:uncharacterized protein SmJEL517_g01982 [Synchytrium microbalum]TPX35645.1 hypothetical protein SmJEL517_g01982 [Synchytrium microbalum]
MSTIAAKLAHLASIRSSILSIPLITTPKARVLAQPSQRVKFLTHYPPNVSNLRLANQDPDLKLLDLVDVRYQELKERELRFNARGKLVRVSVMNGPQKRVEGGKKKKR